MQNSSFLRIGTTTTGPTTATPPPWRRWLVGLLALLALNGLPAWSQGFGTTTSFTPALLNPAAAPTHILLTVKRPIPPTPGGTPTEAQHPFTSLSFTDRIERKTVALNDNGQDGDLVAGDGIHSVRLPTAPFIAALRADDVHRLFIGFLDMHDNGGVKVATINLFLDVLTPDVTLRQVVKLAPDVQATSSLVNIVAPAYFQGQGKTEDITKEFYRWFRDDYDFINLVYMPSRIENAHHIGSAQLDSGTSGGLALRHPAYGSASRLRGLQIYPSSNFFDGASTHTNHEIGHQWMPHWPISSMATGVMGFSGFQGQGSFFDCDLQDQNGKLVLIPRYDAPMFNDVDLYQMGLIPAHTVRTQIMFNGQDDALNVPRICNGQVYDGAYTRLTLQQVLQSLKLPNLSAVPQPVRHRVATILITRDGLASPETMSLYSTLAERAEGRTPTPIHSGFVRQMGMPFYVATRGLATLDTRLGINEPYTIEGRPFGQRTARMLTVTVRPRAEDVGQTRQFFVAALVNGQILFRSPVGWAPMQSGDIPAYLSKPLSLLENLLVFDGRSDLSSLAGAQIFAGYGRDAAEMLAAGRFALVHTVE